jgi:hypothetical protein
MKERIGSGTGTTFLFAYLNQDVEVDLLEY